MISLLQGRQRRADPLAWNRKPCPSPRLRRPCRGAAPDCGTHFSTRRQLAFGQPVAAIFLKLSLAAIGLGATGAEGAFVHLAAHTKRALRRELRSTKRARIGAVTAANAHILVVQHHTLIGTVKAVDRADCHAGRVAAMHAGDRDGFFTRYAVIQSDDPAPVHSPGHLVLVFASRDATVALNATLGVTNKFHTCHTNLL